jgi:DNA-binding NarL/FixJ family response regulator
MRNTQPRFGRNADSCAGYRWWGNMNRNLTMLRCEESVPGSDASDAALIAETQATLPTPAADDEVAVATSIGKRPLVVLIDPRPLTRHSVSQLLEHSMGEANMLAVAGPNELFAEHSEGCGDVRLIIYNIGGAEVRHGEFLRELALLNGRLPDVPVILVADRSHIDDVAEALRRGVRGYIPTTLDPSVAIGALRLVQAGGTFIPESAFREMLEQVAWRGAGEPGTAAAMPGAFTPRQCEVLDLLREGKSNKMIARDLNMQESTVKVHVRQIMKKLKATNRTQAVIIASRFEKTERDA